MSSLKVSTPSGGLTEDFCGCTISYSDFKEASVEIIAITTLSIIEGRTCESVPVVKTL
jgi:hypothetical protein